MPLVLLPTLSTLLPPEAGVEQHPPGERLMPLVLLSTRPTLLPPEAGMEQHPPRERLMPLVLLATLPALLPPEAGVEKHPPCVPLVLLLAPAAAEPGTHCLSWVAWCNKAAKARAKAELFLGQA